MKTARFAAVVARSGQPLNHLVFAAPAQDAALQSAVRAHRVMTIHQEHVGTHKDYGLVGFHPAPHAQYLVFPRSLKSFAGKRIVGVNFELLAQPPVAARRMPRPASPPVATRVIPRFKVPDTPRRSRAPLRPAAFSRAPGRPEATAAATGATESDAALRRAVHRAL